MVPLRLGGLTPDDASGGVWTGHRAQIDTALEQSRRAGLDVKVLGHDPKTNTWRVQYQRREITIVETHTKSAAILSGDDAALREAALNIKPLPGWRDVVVHGTIDDFEIVIDGKAYSVDHRSLAKWLRKGGDGKQRIRLLSCETGKHAKGAAQHLANKLGVEVMAPNDLLHVFEDGSMVIGPTATRNTGSWESFTPKQSERRYSQPKDRATERAIDRLHRARSEGKPYALGDDGVERIDLGAKSDLGDAKIAGQDHADRVSSRIGGNLEPTVKDIAIKSNAADIQVEAGLRVIDQLLGSHAGTELKRVAKQIAAEPDATAKAQDLAAFDLLQTARDDLQKAMLDVLRDPSLDIATRKAKLHALTNTFETAATQVSRVDQTKLGFTQARKAIDALEAKAFDDMIAVDAGGNLTQGGKPIGKLTDMMEQIKATNEALRRHGVDEEYVISVSTPRDATVPREVKVLTRKPKRVDVDPKAATAKKKKHEAVDPSDQSDDGIVVDIGVGTSDYARDVGGETGKVVKTEYGDSYADPSMIRRDLTWKHTAPHVDVDSVVVLGDALQTLPMMFSEHSVKRLFINNINAHYAAGGDSYLTLARGLRQVMKKGGRVEVQWTTSTETTGGETKSRGHITGDGLKEALAATAAGKPRAVSIDESAAPVTDYDYSVEAPRTQSGVPSKTPPSNPVPEKRWVFTFDD